MAEKYVAPSKLPNLLEAFNRVEILIAIAVNGSVRRGQFMIVLRGSDKLMNAGDASGLVTRFKLPLNGGFAFALNPKYPLIDMKRGAY